MWHLSIENTQSTVSWHVYAYHYEKHDFPWSVEFRAALNENATELHRAVAQTVAEFSLIYTT